MALTFKVLDIFAGPGGLAEGFSSVRREGKPVFEIALSVEKERSAWETLRLRSFTRQFEQLPNDYYGLLAGEISLDRLVSAYPDQWKAANAETLRLELASPGADAVIDPRIDAIRESAGDELVLVGGPPCQAYSLAGRARNRGVADYVASEDHRHFLYKEYIRLIGRLRPAAFVMENVKGFLSSSVEGELIFEQVLADLKRAGGHEDSYVILPLAPGLRAGGQQYIVEAERFGIPQRRHRVILFGVRSDLISGDALPAIREQVRLVPTKPPTVREAIGQMARLRSGLSKQPDSPQAWKRAALHAFRAAAAAAFGEEGDVYDSIAERLHKLATETEASLDALQRMATSTAPVMHERLAEWLLDCRSSTLPNHETRGHMGADLARYAFAACFADVTGRSPRANDFPADLAPAHLNWLSGKFNDRFRVQCWGEPATTVTSHISKDGHYFIHPDPAQCRSLTVREAARLQTFPDNYLFLGNRTEQYVQVGNAVPPLLAHQIAEVVYDLLLVLAKRGGATVPRETEVRTQREAA